MMHGAYNVKLIFIIYLFYLNIKIFTFRSHTLLLITLRACCVFKSKTPFFIWVQGLSLGVYSNANNTKLNDNTKRSGI